VPQHRYYDLLPRYLKTSQNKRASAIAEDILYDPESFEPVEGQIGDVTSVREQDLLRDPLISEINEERRNNQLSVGVVTGADGAVNEGAFYADLLGQIVSNGGIVSNTIRLFDTDWFSWTPPIDVDKWTNFVRYVWTGEGDARVNGEYITKDPGGSKATLYLVEGPSTFTAVNVELTIDTIGDFTSGTTIGQLREDPYVNRIIYRWDGANWNVVNWVAVNDLPTTTTLPIGTYLYVARNGLNFNRYTTYTYSAAMTRWIPRLVAIGVDAPSNPVDGMIWENCSTSPNRIFMRYNGTNKTWSQITHGVSVDMTGTGHSTDGETVYHAYHIDDVTDRWEATNWWVHYDDLSLTDRGYVTKEKMGIRPILQLWSCIEAYSGSNRTVRHDVPRFNVYAYKKTSNTILKVNVTNFGTNSVDTERGNTIVQYITGDGADDPILGFPGSFNNTSEFKFQLTLEDQPITVNTSEDLIGYRYFLDKFTGNVRSIWAQAPLDNPIIVENSEFPITLSNNPDHEILKTFSRSEVLRHFINIIGENSSGDVQGSNGYRWTDQQMFDGATIIDCNASLLKPMALLLNEKLDLPDAIRAMGHEHGRFNRRFLKKLQDLWDTGDYSKPDDTFASGVTAESFVDAILTELLAGKTENGAFWLSDMGTYVDYITLEEKPIAIPASTVRVGATRPYTPRKIILNGENKLIGHDGKIIPAWDDDRDNAWLNLEQRFYDQIPAYKLIEDTTITSATITTDQWILNRYITNPDVPAFRFGSEVITVVDNYELETPASPNYRVFSKDHGAFVFSKNGTDWETPIDASYGDYFADNTNIYFYNGVIASIYNVYSYNESENNGTLYTLNEFYQIIRREFERWAIARGKDIGANTTYEANDRFTWNYSSAGVEGHWRGIYRRIYHTDRPHCCPWEICGFTVEPTWWRTTYIPTSTASDGSPRYGSAHAMWNDLRSSGSLMPVTLKDWQIPNSNLPTPVDVDGELIDPITAGIIDDLTNVPENYRADRWKYGDFGPVEAEFWESSEGIFALALCSYLMKPARFTESTWTDYYTPVGNTGSYQIKPYPISVDTVSLTRPSITAIPVHGELLSDEETIYENPALVSWISEVLVMTGANPKVNFGDIVRNSRTALGWRCGGFINIERTTMRTYGGVEIPQENMNVLVHIAKPTDIHFHSGVIIVRDSTNGYRVYGYDPSDPYFRIRKSAKPVIAGQVFLREEFTSIKNQKTYTVTNFTVTDNNIGKISVLIDGFAIDARYITVSAATNSIILDNSLSIAANQRISIILSSSQTTQSTRQRQFVVNGRTFFYYPVSTNEVIEYPYGYLFTSNQDVVEFLVDHGKWMVNDGWVYGDDENPDVAKNDWLAVATRFASWSTVNRRPGEIYIDVAGGKNLKFRVDHGHILDVESTSNGSYSVVDMGSFPIQPTETVVSRIGGEMTIESPTKEIYGLRIRISEIEHVVFLPTYTKFNDLLYQPVTGLKHPRLLVKTYRSKNWKGRFEAPGHVIFRDKLLPNFEKQVDDFTRFYDRVNPVDNTSYLEQSWNLYNWYKKPYMETIGASVPMALDYHRGMVRQKGTKVAFKSFAKGTVSGIDGTYLTDNWAWKVADYGNLSARKRTKFRIYEREVRDKIQIVRFVDEESQQDSMIEVLPYDRNNPADTRWIVPPSYEDVTNLTFPMNSSGQPEPDKYCYRLMLVSSDSTLPQQQVFFHWDPSIGLHSPEAYSQIDITSPVDTARYNQGTKANRAIGFEWGREHVGTIWWNTSKRVYDDYRNRTTLREKTNNWGRLSYYKIIAQVVNNVDITFTTSEDHDFEEDDSVILIGSDGKRYEATITYIDDANSFTAVVRLDDDLEPVFLDTLEIPVFKEVTQYDIEIYQWIESLVPPVAHENTSDRVLDAADASYVERSIDGVTYYYYWVKWVKDVIDGKSLSIYDIENRLRDPSANGLPWFAPISENALAFNVAGITIDDNSALEVLIDGMNIDVHAEWVLLRENHPIERTPVEAVQKLIDSLLGVDSLGGVIPNAYLLDEEKYGTSRWQTVFRDRDKARAVFLRSVNTILSYRNRTEDIDFYDVFVTDEEGTWWSKADYLEEDKLNLQVSMIVKELSDRDSIRLMQENDVIRVLNGILDPILGGSNYGYGLYEYDGTNWVEFGSANTTAELNDSIWALENAHQKIKDILAVLLPEEESFIIFALINEMMNQNKSCHWCFKTSLIDVTNTVYVSQPTYRPKDELIEILQNVSEVKPFHSKVRDTSTIVYPDQEAVSPIIDDFNVHSIVQLNDRLSSNGFDDFAWDTMGWDIHPWDYEPWYMENLGRDAWFELERFEPNAVTRIYNVVARAQPGHELRVIAYDQNGEITVTPGCVVEIESDTTVTVEFTQIPPQTLIYAIEQSYGAVYGNSPSLPAAITDQYSWLEPYESSYEHAAIRGQEYVIGASRTLYNEHDDTFGDASSLTGNDSGERVRSTATDQFIIQVDTYETPAYAGWDAVPWDLNQWDHVISNIAPNKFYVTSDDYRVDVASYNESLTSSTLVGVEGLEYNLMTARQSNDRLNISSVTLEGFTLEENVDYVKLNNSTVQLFDRPNESFVADFETRTFTSQFPIDSVKIGSTTLAEDTDYTLDNADKTIITLINDSIAGVIELVPYKVSTFGQVILNCDWLETLSNDVILTQTDQNFLLDSIIDGADWTASNVSFTTGLANPVAIDAGAPADSCINVIDGSNTQTGYVSTTNYTGVGVPTPLCRRTVSCFISKIESAPHCALKLKFTGDTDVEYIGVFNPNTGSFTASSNGAHVTVDDVYDFWKISLEAQNNDSDNDTTEIEFYPAYNSNGSINANVATTGFNAVWGFQLYDSNKSVRYTYSIGSPVNSTYLGNDPDIDPIRHRINYNESTGNFIVYPGTVSVAFNKAYYLSSSPIDVDDVTDDRTTYYSSGTSFDDYLSQDGLVILDTSNGGLYERSSNAWVSIKTAGHRKYVSKRTLNTWSWNGSAWEENETRTSSPFFSYEHGVAGSAIWYGRQNQAIDKRESSVRADKFYASTSISSVMNVWCSAQGGREEDIDGNIVHWYNTAATNEEPGFVQTDVLNSPTFTLPGGLWKNSGLVFTSAAPTWLQNNDSNNTFEDIFSGGGGSIIIVLTVDTLANAVITEKRNEGLAGWSLQITSTGLIRFYRDFSGTTGQWTADAGNEFTTGAKYIIELSYIDGNVANNPILKINGTTVTLVENATPVGTALGDSGLPIMIGVKNDLTTGFDGKIHEYMILRRPLTTAESEEITSVLTDAWI
jgi:hypothetical protein